MTCLDDLMSLFKKNASTVGLGKLGSCNAKGSCHRSILLS